MFSPRRKKDAAPDAEKHSSSGGVLGELFSPRKAKSTESRQKRGASQFAAKDVASATPQGPMDDLRSGPAQARPAALPRATTAPHCACTVAHRPRGPCRPCPLQQTLRPAS